MSACASGDNGSSFRDTARDVARSTAAYEREPEASCTSANLQAARSGAERAQARWGGDGADVRRQTEIGDMLVEIADTARRRGCPDVAEAIYVDVIGTYVGPRFSRLRDRARQGMKRLPPAV